MSSLLVLLYAAISANASAEQPNIVLLVGDDVGYSDLGSYGSEISTPNIDQLARSGVQFSNFHVTASCSPTRSMLMTGVDNHLNGLGNMTVTMPFDHEGKPGYDGVLNHRVATIAEMLRNNGYHTYHLGKWHLGNAPEKRPINRGFERTITLGDTGADNWEQRSYLPTYEYPNWYADGEEFQLPEDFYSSKYFVDKAIEFIDSNKVDGKPFFTYIGFQAVHIPVQAPLEFVDKYEETYQVGWHKIRARRLAHMKRLGLIPSNTMMRNMDSTKDWQEQTSEEKALAAKSMAVYAGMLEAMDFHIGRLVQHLKDVGEYDNTVFIFLSDNGAEPSDPLNEPAMIPWLLWNYSTEVEGLGGKGTYAAIGPSWASTAASPGSFYKFYAGEGGVRVPLIISAPALIDEARIEKSFGFIKDLVPTLLDFTDTENHNGNFAGRPVEPITGLSLVPLLKGDVKAVHDENEAIGYELSGNAALYQGDYKLMKNLLPLGDGEWHLYNIVTDPGESQDLRSQQPERYQTMLNAYQEYAEKHGVLSMPEGYNYVKQVTLYTALVMFKRNLVYWIGALGTILLILFWRYRRT